MSDPNEELNEELNTDKGVENNNAGVIDENNNNNTQDIGIDNTQDIGIDNTRDKAKGIDNNKGEFDNIRTTQNIDNTGDTGDTGDNAEGIDGRDVTNADEANIDNMTKVNTLNNSGKTDIKYEDKNEDKKESITIEINKPFLSNLTQRLNPALLVSLVTYINILTKMKELEPTNTGLDDDIKEFKSIKDSLSTLLRKVQETLKIDEDKREDPDKIINNMASSETFTNFLLFIQSIFSAAVPLSAAAAAAAILGGKKKRTRRQKAAKATKKKTKKHN
jgi:hypothetical protein